MLSSSCDVTAHPANTHAFPFNTARTHVRVTRSVLSSCDHHLVTLNRPCWKQHVRDLPTSDWARQLSFTLPNEDLGRPNPSFPSAFPGKHFSAIRLLHRVLTPLKCLETPDGIFCSSIQHLRLGGFKDGQVELTR